MVREGFLEEELDIDLEEKGEVFKMHLDPRMTTGLEMGVGVANAMGIEGKKTSLVFRTEGISQPCITDLEEIEAKNIKKKETDNLQG